jgi:hypothetical protein
VNNPGQSITPAGTRRTQAGDSLADVLDRVLDKGVVIAGDIAIAVVGIELLTIKIRLLVASADKAREMGIDWWRSDPFLAGKPLGSGNDEQSNEMLLERVRRLEAQVAEGQPPRRTSRGTARSSR